MCDTCYVLVEFLDKISCMCVCVAAMVELEIWALLLGVSCLFALRSFSPFIPPPCSETQPKWRPCWKSVDQLFPPYLLSPPYSFSFVLLKSFFVVNCFFFVLFFVIIFFFCFVFCYYYFFFCIQYLATFWGGGFQSCHVVHDFGVLRIRLPLCCSTLGRPT
jgi:hypothetical protein